MHHDRLRAAGGKEIAVRHTHCGVLMRRDDWLGQVRARIALGPCQAFDDRRKISSGIEEKVVDAEGLQAP